MTGVTGTDRGNNLRSHDPGSSGFVGGSGTNYGTEPSFEFSHAPPYTHVLRAPPDQRGCGARLQDFLASAWRTVESYMPCIGHAEHAYGPVPSEPQSGRSSGDGEVTPYVINTGMSAAAATRYGEYPERPYGWVGHYRGWANLPVEIVDNIGRHLVETDENEEQNLDVAAIVATRLTNLSRTSKYNFASFQPTVVVARAKELELLPAEVRQKRFDQMLDYLTPPKPQVEPSGDTPGDAPPVRLTDTLAPMTLKGRSEGLAALAEQLRCFRSNNEAAEVQTRRFYGILSAAADLPDSLKAPVLAELGGTVSSLNSDAREAAFADVMQITEALSPQDLRIPVFVNMVQDIEQLSESFDDEMALLSFNEMLRVSDATPLHLQGPVIDMLIRALTDLLDDRKPRTFMAIVPRAPQGGLCEYRDPVTDMYDACIALWQRVRALPPSEKPTRLANFATALATFEDNPPWAGELYDALLTENGQLPPAEQWRALRGLAVNTWTVPTERVPDFFMAVWDKCSQLSAELQNELTETPLEQAQERLDKVRSSLRQYSFEAMSDDHKEEVLTRLERRGIERDAFLDIPPAETFPETFQHVVSDDDSD